MRTSDKPLLLMTDPEPYSFAIVEMILGLDYWVVRASTVRQALERAIRDRPVAIISELFLADGSFLELRASIEKAVPDPWDSHPDSD